jgi:hypothetical protein
MCADTQKQAFLFFNGALGGASLSQAIAQRSCEVVLRMLYSS